MTLKEAAIAALDILKKVMEEKLTSTNVEVSLKTILFFTEKSFENFRRTPRKNIGDEVHCL